MEKIKCERMTRTAAAGHYVIGRRMWTKDDITAHLFASLTKELFIELKKPAKYSSRVSYFDSLVEAFHLYLAVYNIRPCPRS